MNPFHKGQRVRLSASGRQSFYLGQPSKQVREGEVIGGKKYVNVFWDGAKSWSAYHPDYIEACPPKEAEEK